MRIEAPQTPFDLGPVATSTVEITASDGRILAADAPVPTDLELDGDAALARFELKGDNFTVWHYVSLRA